MLFILAPSGNSVGRSPRTPVPTCSQRAGRIQHSRPRVRKKLHSKCQAEKEPPRARSWGSSFPRGPTWVCQSGRKGMCVDFCPIGSAAGTAARSTGVGIYPSSAPAGLTSCSLPSAVQSGCDLTGGGCGRRTPRDPGN